MTSTARIPDQECLKSVGFCSVFSNTFEMYQVQKSLKTRSTLMESLFLQDCELQNQHNTSDTIVHAKKIGVTNPLEDISLS